MHSVHRANTKELDRGVRSMLNNIKSGFSNAGVGRNSKCPCGSDLKYKNCCLPVIDNPNATVDDLQLLVDKHPAIKSTLRDLRDKQIGEEEVAKVTAENHTSND